jgi:hypothetical protein
MTPPQVPRLLIAAVIVYVGLCAGLIAHKHDKNPLLYGLLAVISPLNMILLGIWAFGKFERKKTDDN